MELLIYPQGSEFIGRTRLYEEHLEPLGRKMDEAVRNRLGQLSTYNAASTSGHLPLLTRYATYFRWPIRKLEYSYVLRQVMDRARSGMVTLDAGCGITPLAHLFATRGCQSHAIDVDRELIELVRKEGAQLYGGQVNYSCQDLTKLEFPDNYVDIITCVSVLEHMPRGDDTKAVGGMLRVLRPGGLLAFTVDLIPENAYPANGGQRWHPILTAKYLALKALSTLRTTAKPGSTNEAQVKINRKKTRPYTFAEVTRYLVRPFEANIYGTRLNRVSLSMEEIKNFWRSHWHEGSCYDYEKAREYVSLGITLVKR